MSSGERQASTLPTAALALGAVAQAGLSYLGFRHPRKFWPLLTVGLSACGLPGLRRLARRPQPAPVGWLLLGGVAGAAGYVVTLLGASLLGRLPLGQRSLERLQACTKSVSRPVAALLVIPSGLGEEVFWRESVLGRRLGSGARSDLSCLIRSTLAYVAVEAGSLEPLPPLGALLLGSGAGWIRIRSRSIWPPVVAHLIYAELCLVAPGLPPARAGVLDRSNSTT